MPFLACRVQCGQIRAAETMMTRFASHHAHKPCNRLGVDGMSCKQQRRQQSLLLDSPQSSQRQRCKFCLLRWVIPSGLCAPSDTALLLTALIGGML